ncbi:hypothetical protein ANCCEY_07461 [Ancylostoma ceylanicum]|uniref:Bromodomain associated domain-containing protein n=1 Tax=Ancylostoma ceylanicum TaxID=53326 RepID=A0A0D6LNL8_9BILA|nr:hypothetical protein ANCCEY_07461 [Ancylostoma ceylanicum]
MDVLHEYINIQIRCATARCLAQLGFTQTSSVCFDAMSDIMELYLKKFASCVQYYMEQRDPSSTPGGETTPCVMDVARAFDYMRVSRHELFEYMRQVRPMEPILPDFHIWDKDMEGGVLKIGTFHATLYSLFI